MAEVQSRASRWTRAGAPRAGGSRSALCPGRVLQIAVGPVDRLRRRPLMVASDLLRAVVLAAVPLAWLLDRLMFPLLLVLVVVFGVVSLVNDAASMSFVPRLVPRAQLQRAHARLDGAGAVAQTAYPPWRAR